MVVKYQWSNNKGTPSFSRFVSTNVSTISRRQVCVGARDHMARMGGRYGWELRDHIGRTRGRHGWELRDHMARTRGRSGWELRDHMARTRGRSGWELRDHMARMDTRSDLSEILVITKR